ncbi:MAG: hypothetical protein CL610_00505 [Anaerolineaceae bacterium]|nr:hypothetical protein [Anaerolineaceae bacterium]
MLPLMTRLMLITGIVLVLTIGLLVGLAHSQPLLDQYLDGLALCTVPCWIGIEPGRTPFAAVQNIIAQRFPERRWQVRGIRSYMVYPTEDGNRATIDDSNGLVYSIQLRATLPLWRLLLLFDEPACYQRTESNPVVFDVYWRINDIYVHSHFLAAPSNPEWRSEVLVLTRVAKDPCIDLSAWRGLASLRLT